MVALALIGGVLNMRLSLNFTPKSVGANSMKLSDSKPEDSLF
jgi:hypothetical protein